MEIAAVDPAASLMAVNNKELTGIAGVTLRQTLNVLFHRYKKERS